MCKTFTDRFTVDARKKIQEFKNNINIAVATYRQEQETLNATLTESLGGFKNHVHILQ